MLLLEGVALTDSGRPVLAPEELELRILEKCDFEFCGGKGGLVEMPGDKYTAGIAFLTTHRLIWLDQVTLPAPGRSCSLHLSRMQGSHPVPLKMFGSRTRRLRLNCAANGGGGGQENDRPGDLKLAFRGESPTEFSKCLEDAVLRKQWNELGRTRQEGREGGNPSFPNNTRGTPSFPRGVNPPPPPSGNTTNTHAYYGGTNLGPSSDQTKTASAKKETPANFRRAGVGGALARQQSVTTRNAETLGSAFFDMDALMQSAKELVRLAERFAAATRDEGGGDGDRKDERKTASSSSDTSQNRHEVREMLIQMGIASPVTKETSGALYHKQLSRQLADWLPAMLRLEKHGGVMTLPDVYCLFNRARGSEMVSPEDVLKAATLWGELKITQVRFRAFASGVRVAHLANRGDDEVCAALASHDGEKMDSFVASHVLGVTPAVAGEYLAMAETYGIVARDEAPETTWWYPNRFPGFKEVDVGFAGV